MVFAACLLGNTCSFLDGYMYNVVKECIKHMHALPYSTCKEDTRHTSTTNQVGGVVVSVNDELWIMNSELLMGHMKNINSPILTLPPGRPVW